jgi:leucyl/phenylalanyl-tRNA--protein transferase
MFSLAPNASKIALWYFCHHFTQSGGKLIDCQVMNPHLESLGAIEMSRDDFLSRLQQHQQSALELSCFSPQTLSLAIDGGENQ